MGAFEDAVLTTLEESRADLKRISGAKAISHKAEDAKQTADQAKERAEEAISEAASRLGYIDFQELLQEDKLSGELPGVYIRNVAAESILAGDITASLINITGRLQAGRTVLDSTGLHLRSIISAVNRPSEDVNYKITPYENNQSAFWFYEGSNVRGATIRTDGDSSTDGRVEFAATRFGDLSALSSARLRINAVGSGAGVVNVDPDLYVYRNATVNNDLNVNRNIVGSMVHSTDSIGPQYPGGTYARQLYLSPTAIANSNTIHITHNYRVAPDFVHVQAVYTGWVTLSGNGNNWDVSADDQRVSITNRSGASRLIRASIMSGG